MKILGGYTGLVGGHLRRADSFDLLINSSNVAEAKNRKADYLVWAGVKAEKWKANQNPAEDQKHVEEIARLLKSITAEQAILISTVDVYNQPLEVNEETVIDKDANHAYGRNRRWLEEEFANHFPNSLIVRLPALFGMGLKKNVIYDFIHNNDVHKIHSKGSFQFYDLSWLAKDIRIARDAGLRILNLTTEPISVADIAREAFGFEFNNEPTPQFARYDIKSLHSRLWSDQGTGYMYNREQVLSGLRSYLKQVRGEK